MAFRFKEDVTPDENIALFMAHLETLDKELAQVLKSNISQMIPFPTDPQVRSTRRIDINTRIRKAVDAITP